MSKNQVGKCLQRIHNGFEMTRLITDNLKLTRTMLANVYKGYTMGLKLPDFYK